MEISLDKSGDIRPQSRTMDRQIKCILVIIPPTGIDICDGMSFTIANASQYPYLLEIVSPIMELTGEIVMGSSHSRSILFFCFFNAQVRLLFLIQA